jgi:hypothetical protein
MTVLVCGGRNYLNDAEEITALNNLHAMHQISLMVIGGASGADDTAEKWAKNRRISRFIMEAQWGIHDRSAGPIRNRQMLHFLRQQPGKKLVAAFPGNKGTEDMINISRKAGIPVWLAPNQPIPDL